MEALAVLRSRNFQRLLLGANLSVAGAQATRIALLLYVVQSQGRVPDLALLVVMETVPGAIVAPFAGALVDRSRKQALMLGANVGRIGLLALLIAHPAYWMICVVVGCQSMLLVLNRRVPPPSRWWSLRTTCRAPTVSIRVQAI